MGCQKSPTIDFGGLLMTHYQALFMEYDDIIIGKRKNSLIDSLEKIKNMYEKRNHCHEIRLYNLSSMDS